MLKVVRERLVDREGLPHSPDGVGTKRPSVTAVPVVVNWITGSAAGSNSCDDPTQIFDEREQTAAEICAHGQQDNTAEERGAWTQRPIFLEVNRRCR